VQFYIVDILQEEGELILDMFGFTPSSIFAERNYVRRRNSGSIFT